MSKSDVFKKMTSTAKETIDEAIEGNTNIDKKYKYQEDISEGNQKQITMTFSINSKELRDDFKLYTDVYSLNRSELIREFMTDFLSDKQEILSKLRKVK